MAPEQVGLTGKSLDAVGQLRGDVADLLYSWFIGRAPSANPSICLAGADGEHASAHRSIKSSLVIIRSTASAQSASHSMGRTFRQRPIAAIEAEIKLVVHAELEEVDILAHVDRLRVDPVNGRERNDP